MPPPWAVWAQSVLINELRFRTCHFLSITLHTINIILRPIRKFYQNWLTMSPWPMTDSRQFTFINMLEVEIVFWVAAYSAHYAWRHRCCLIVLGFILWSLNVYIHNSSVGMIEMNKKTIKFQVRILQKYRINLWNPEEHQREGEICKSTHTTHYNTRNTILNLLRVFYGTWKIIHRN